MWEGAVFSGMLSEGEGGVPGELAGGRLWLVSVAFFSFDRL